MLPEMADDVEAEPKGPASSVTSTEEGAGCVRAYGGRVLLAELLPGHATSAILKNF